MARFMVVHKSPAMVTQDELRKEAKAIVSALPNDVEWLRSWAAYESDRLFCEWEAPEEGALRAALKGTKFFPLRLSTRWSPSIPAGSEAREPS